MIEPNQTDSKPKPRVALVSIYDIYNLGTRYIHSVLVSAGYPCDFIILKLNFKPGGFMQKPRDVSCFPAEREFELLGELFSRQRPDIVGISLNSCVLKIAERITQVAREAVSPMVVWGGSHPTLMPEQCLEVADAVCVGEGEAAMLDLMDAIDGGRSIHEIPNLWVRNDGEVYKNSPRPLNQDLDAIPFPVIGHKDKFAIDVDKILDQDVYLDPGSPILYSIVTSRGCPFRCTFCNNDTFREIHKGLGKFLRFRSPENVIGELEQAFNSLDINMIGFQDDLFGMNRKWTKNFFPLYKEKIGRPFVVEIHPRYGSEQFAADMSDAGGTIVHMGVQSGSERTRREDFERPESNDDVIEAARAFLKNRIITWFDFIFDNPYETRPDLIETLDLMLALPRPHNLKMFSLCYLPGTRISKKAQAEGKISPDQEDQYSSKGITQHWVNYHSATDRDNAFYVTLAWMENLKFNYERMQLVFFNNYWGDSFHVLPRWLIRGLSRSKFFYNHTRILHLALSLGMSSINRVLVPLHMARTVVRLIVSGKWGELGGRIRAKLG